MAFVGCHNNNPDTSPTASTGGVGGGGSTDSYGTGPDARLRSTGNIGVNSGETVGNNGVSPAVTAGERTPNNQPPQTPTGPGGGTGAAGTGNYSNGTGNVQGSTTGRESGAGVRTNAVPNNKNPNSGNNNAGAVVGGTAGNGTTGTGQPVPGPNQGR
jgi:hypothetical protein